MSFNKNVDIDYFTYREMWMKEKSKQIKEKKPGIECTSNKTDPLPTPTPTSKPDQSHQNETSKFVEKCPFCHQTNDNAMIISGFGYVKTCSAHCFLQSQ